MTFDNTNHFSFDSLRTRCRQLACLFLFITCLPVIAQAQVATADKFTTPEGFEASLVYKVPKGQGSWVSLTNDPQGRLIACDQYGALYRIKLTDGKADVLSLIHI